MIVEAPRAHKQACNVAWNESGLMWGNWWNRVVSACACLCKSTRERARSARTGCPFLWSLSIAFLCWSLSAETFRRDKLDDVKASLWPVGPTWGYASLYSPSWFALQLFVWVRFQCRAVWMSVQCVIAADRCLVLLIRNISDVVKHPTQPRRTRLVAWFHSNNAGKNNIPDIPLTSLDVWLLSWCVIFCHPPCFFL